jgi:hypothetical protein
MMPSIILKSDDARPSMQPERSGFQQQPVIWHRSARLRHAEQPVWSQPIAGQQGQAPVAGSKLMNKKIEALPIYETSGASIKPSNEFVAMGLYLENS